MRRDRIPMPSDLKTEADPLPSAPRRRARWPFVVAAVVLLLALAGAIWWFVWVPNWRPALQDGERYGIDVSAHQDAIDWQRVAEDNIRFAYIKATEGGDFVDKRFDENWRGAGAAGLDRGAYHFFTLCTPGEAQARNFLTIARRRTRPRSHRQLTSNSSATAAADQSPVSSTSNSTGSSTLSRRHGVARSCSMWGTSTNASTRSGNV